MDDADRHLLNLIQSDFPLTSRPYAALGLSLGMGEQEVMDRLARLRAKRIVRQISAIFDTRSLGYKSTLVAMQVDPARIGRAAKIINEHPGVSHNYERNHAFNLWFTIAVPPTSSLEATVDRLHHLAGATSTRMLFTKRLFKIGVNLDMTGERPIDAIAEPQYDEDDRARSTAYSLTSDDIAVIREVQQDLPVEPAPFAPMAARLGISEDHLFQACARLKEYGFMRRYAAILYHRKAGFTANAMGVWAVPEERVAEIGPRVASFAAVSHCYQRPTYPDWPYSIFSMVHGRSQEECEDILRAISRATGITDYLALYSTREYKKVRLLYFTDAYADWEARYLQATTASR